MMLERSIRSDILEPLLLVAVAVTFREVMVRTLNKKKNIRWKNRSGPIRSDPIRFLPFVIIHSSRCFTSSSSSSRHVQRSEGRFTEKAKNVDDVSRGGSH